MEDYLQKLSDFQKKISLSERERGDIERSLSAFVADHPARMSSFLNVRQSVRSIFEGSGSRTVHFGFRIGMATLVLVLVAGAGTSYSAEQALPGDPLYGIKISLNEPVERIATASSQSQAQWDVTLVNKRLVEAEKLVANGTLTAGKVAIVQSQIDSATKDLNTDVTASIDSTSNMAGAGTSNVTQAVTLAEASNVQSDLEASLVAHAQVLDALATNMPSSDANVVPLVATIRTHVEHARSARIAALDALDTSATPTLSVAANGELHTAVAQLVTIPEIPSVVTRARGSGVVPASLVDASTTQQHIREGNANLAQGNYRGAFTAFQAAARHARAAQVVSQAQASFGVQITMPPVPVPMGATIAATSTTSARPNMPMNVSGSFEPSATATQEVHGSDSTTNFNLDDNQ